MNPVMNLIRPFATLSTLGLLAVACDAPTPEPTPEKPAGTVSSSSKPAASAKPTASAKPEAPKRPVQGPFPESTDPLLEDPTKNTLKAPDVFKVKFETSAGDFEIECNRSWGPNGADRIYNLAKIGFFNDVSFFRVVKTPKPFVVQFGIHGNPKISKLWQEAKIAPDETQTDEKAPNRQSNTRGMVTFAMAGSPDSRTTQLFINFGDNSNLDKMKFAPICKVVDPGMEVVEKIHFGYAERITSQQGAIIAQGNAFLRERYPELDYIKTTRIVGDDPKTDDKDKKDKDKKPEEKKQNEKKPVEEKPEPKPKLPPPPT
jgi:peptidyl-prolyl cis-trans isomerase A (cyclophilin A)